MSPDFLSYLIWVQTIIKIHHTTLVGPELNLQKQLLSDLYTVFLFMSQL